MVVKTQCNGHEVNGLSVGAHNVRRYFPKYIAAIELQLDHLRIECELPLDFWNGHPEIRDPRLCLWLQCKLRYERPCQSPILLAMTQLGESSFKLEPTPLKVESKIGKVPRSAVLKSELHHQVA